MTKKTTIFLMVEDDQNDVILVEQEFKSAPKNIQLRVVHDGSQAMQYLEGQGKYYDRGHYPMPDVILLDLKLPRLNGFGFLEWLRNKSSGDLKLIPVVVFSYCASREEIKRAYVLGVNSYLVKPVKWEEFRERL